MRVYASAGGVHLDVREKPPERRFLVNHGVSAEEDAGVVLRQLGLDAYLTPPIANEGLGVLPDGVGRSLEDDSERNAVVLANAVAVGLEDAVVVQQAIGAFDVLG